MTDRELMQQALEALETKGEHHPRVYQAIAALREGLAQPETPYVIDCPRCGHCCPQPEQEPVAWRYRGNLHEFDPSDWAEGPVTPLYKAPPQRQWVGLTYEEIKSLPSWWPSYEDAPALIELVKDIEANLKEKNT
jgi:hypothetical protein